MVARITCELSTFTVRYIILPVLRDAMLRNHKPHQVAMDSVPDVVIPWRVPS